MSVNQLQIQDVYAVMNELHNQVTGRKALTPVDTNSYISQATATLAVGTDKVMETLSIMVSRTVFAVRNYDGIMPSLQADSMAWGGILRKISFADKPAKEDKVYHDLIDGTSVDQYVRNNPEVLEMRFYGSASWQDFYTVYRTQLREVFLSPEQFGSWLAGFVTEWNNKYTQWKEELSMGAVANFIGAKFHLNNGVVHLLTEYNTETGLSLTAGDIYKPDYVKPFFEWVKARIDTLSELMTARSGLFQVQVLNKNVNRNTPYADQKLFITSKALKQIKTTVLPEAYHNENLDYAKAESIPYWQNIQSANAINVNASYIDANGTVQTQEGVTVNNIFGLIFDKDAIVYTIKDESVDVTSLNARGRYYNVFMSANATYLNDLTEKGILLLLD